MISAVPTYERRTSHPGRNTLVKIMLGMLARSDRTQEPLIERILSVIGPCFDDIAIVEDEGRRITDYGAQRNRLVEIGERKGFDWMMQLDSDECMFPADIETVKSLCIPGNRLVVLPRYEFVKDFDHYDPTGYPDYQGRVFRLRVGYRFGRRVHEGLYRRFSPLSEMRLRRGVFSDSTPIYHYGRVKTPAELLLKFLNYDLIAAGESPVDELPADINPDDGIERWGAVTPFERPHPLGKL
ncbi:MAG TPA: hypothetical protein VIK11_11750 [Tepidiformaceae bacterium]